MTAIAISPGQTYRSADPRGGSSIRIESYRPGDARAHVVDAQTGKRFRQILVSALHASSTTKAGHPRRTGYVLVGGTAPDVNELLDRVAKLKAARRSQPRVTPAEAAAALDVAVRSGNLIACYSTCWECKFDQHCEPPAPHPWWDSEDVEHAKATGRPAPTGNCACHCAKPAEDPQP